MVRLHTELTLASFPVHLKDSQRKNNWIEMISLQLLTLYFEGSSFQGDLKALDSEGAAVVGRLLD